MKEPLILKRSILTMSTEIKLYENIFKIINELKFDNSLPMPRFLITEKVSEYGSFICNEIIKNKSEMQFTFKLNLKKCFGDVENATYSIFHNMIHMHCFLNDIQDISNHGVYHNKHFAYKVISLGGTVNKNKYGYRIEKIDDEIMMNVCKLTSDYSSKKIYKNNYDKIAKSSTRKYMCPCCGNSFRATKNINVLCMDCNEPFVIVKHI